MGGKFNSIINGFMEKLNDIGTDKRINLKKANEGIHLCNNALFLLKGMVEKQGFNSVDEEIYFFKQVKSEPLGYLVYFTEVRSCQLRLPKLGFHHQLSFLKKRIRRINKFFNRNWDFVHYMEQELTYLDHQYFTRENQIFPLYALPEACYLDPTFFTSHDMLWARIKGMNSYARYIKNLIQQIEDLHKNNGVSTAFDKKLQWTASKTALTELIYALHSGQVINDGQEDLKNIANTFEMLFDVKLDNIYKTYSEIKARKGSRARFLEELQFRLNHRMDQDDQL
ncbi:RteC protein [Zhouia amylolytica]|uniref:RteC protein n=1 Tax=Zhouia amylolytica TaxID=376730 RepID=A0A1I6T409_9FLAO|nr:RteC domain-containing protein [Zhouia amylolytica]SFS83982.1 RteC protein [Zhouia amylolytica]